MFTIGIERGQMKDRVDKSVTQKNHTTSLRRELDKSTRVEVGRLVHAFTPWCLQTLAVFQHLRSATRQALFGACRTFRILLHAFPPNALWGDIKNGYPSHSCLQRHKSRQQPEITRSDKRVRGPSYTVAYSRAESPAAVTN